MGSGFGREGMMVAEYALSNRQRVTEAFLRRNEVTSSGLECPSQDQHPCKMIRLPGDPSLLVDGNRFLDPAHREDVVAGIGGGLSNVGQGPRDSRVVGASRRATKRQGALIHRDG